MKIDTALCGWMGIELNPNEISAEERRQIQCGVELYKQLRPFFQTALLYRGLSPYKFPVHTLNYVSLDKKKSVFFAFRRGTDNLPQYYPLPGLDPQLSYKIKELNPGAIQQVAPIVMSGKELIERGVKIDFPEQNVPTWEVKGDHDDLFKMPKGIATLGSVVLEAQAL